MQTLIEKTLKDKEQEMVDSILILVDAMSKASKNRAGCCAINRYAGLITNAYEKLETYEQQRNAIEVAKSQEANGIIA